MVLWHSATHAIFPGRSRRDGGVRCRPRRRILGVSEMSAKCQRRTGRYRPTRNGRLPWVACSMRCTSTRAVTTSAVEAEAA